MLVWIGVVAVAVAVAPAVARTAGSQPKLLIGVSDDTALWLSRPNGIVAAEQALGVRAVRMMVLWRRDQTIPSRRQQTWLRRIALTVALGQRVVLSVYGRAANAPTDQRARTAYCHFVAHVVKRIPIQDVVIWNEANNPLFWPRGDAVGYERLLARCWDELHGVRRSINVIDSTAPHQDPAAFLLALGRAYRASGRRRPLLDTYGHNVYPENSSEAPAATHDNGSIDEGDYQRLLSVLSTAFAGTPQPLPGQGTTRIWYLEDGFQTRPTAAKRRLYSGHETDPAPVPADAPAGPRNPASAGAPQIVDQGTQLRAAIELAYCQPDVGAFFNFELIDDHRLDGWQSGLLWSDGSQKPAAATLRATIAATTTGTIDCTDLTSTAPANADEQG